MNDRKKTFFWAGIIAVAALSVFSVVWAVSNTVYVNDGGTYIDNSSPQVGGEGEVSFGALADTVRPARLLPVQNLSVAEQTELLGTTTPQEITLGSRFSESLDFTAGTATTTGSLASIQNTGDLKICQRGEIHISSQVEGSMMFSLSTSTSATAFSGSVGNLIASTTVPTGTTALLTSSPDDHVGTSNMDSFLWPNGTYIFAAASPSFNTASSSDYSTATGKLYLNCHTL